MPDIEVIYVTGDRLLIQVRDHHVVVDQPTEFGGDDVGPTPTELFVASLAACVGFYAERFLRRHAIPAGGLKVEAGFEMSHDRPARVKAIALRLALPAGFPAARLQALEAVVTHCTVHNSLLQSPEIRVSLEEQVPAAA